MPGTDLLYGAWYCIVLRQRKAAALLWLLSKQVPAPYPATRLLRNVRYCHMLNATPQVRHLWATQYACYVSLTVLTDGRLSILRLLSGTDISSVPNATHLLRYVRYWHTVAAQ
eukprot:1477975-Rhodomonas_salina.1